MDVDSIANWSTVRPNARPETQRQQHIPQFPVVVAVPRRIEAEQLRISLFIYIEIRDEVIAP